MSMNDNHILIDVQRLSEEIADGKTLEALQMLYDACPAVARKPAHVMEMAEFRRKEASKFKVGA